MDKLWAMEVFVRVMECGSFSRAAESLDLANATVTSSLRNLEKHLGVTLIQRNTRHLRLTEEGELFLPTCHEVIFRFLFRFRDILFWFFFVNEVYKVVILFLLQP